MKKRCTQAVMGSSFLFLGMSAFTGDLTCYGYTSTTNHFACNIPPANSGNCVWWAAYKRPDIAEKITGSGWNGGQWYGKLRNMGFLVDPIFFGFLPYLHA